MIFKILLFLILSFSVLPKIAFADSCSIDAPNSVGHPDDPNISLFEVTVTTDRNFGNVDWILKVGNTPLGPPTIMKTTTLSPTRRTFLIANDARGLASSSYIFGAQITGAQILCQTTHATSISNPTLDRQGSHCFDIALDYTCVNVCEHPTTPGQPGKFIDMPACIAGLPPINARCSLTPTPSRGQAFSIQAVNLPVNQSFRADLVAGSNVTHTPSFDSGQNRNVLIPISTGLDEGTYTINLYDRYNRLACTVPLNLTTSAPISPIVGGGAGNVARSLGDLLHNSGIPGFKFEDAKLGSVLSGLLDIAFMIAAFLTFYFLIWGAWSYIFANGEKENLAKAREKIKWALIGLLMVAGAYTITTYTGQIFGPDKGGLPF